MARFKVEVSAGEFFDRMSILELKAERLTDTQARARAAEALEVLRRALPGHAPPGGFEEARAALAATNASLWDLEEELRALERQGDFAGRFVEVARGVRRHNDDRALLKRRIDELLGSEVLEDKSYL